MDLKRTAVLAMDYQELLVNGYTTDAKKAIAKVTEVLSKARSANLPVIYVTVGFSAGYPEVNENNMIFRAVRDGQRFLPDSDDAQIPLAIAPQDGDLRVTKHRVSAFEGTNLEVLLRAQGIDTLILFGITTSGVVLSTVRQAADRDYKLIVLEDLCYDTGDVHQFLMENILNRQARITTSDAFLESLA